MEMYSVLAHDIMFRAWIWEIIHLDIILDAFPDETQAMLPYNHRVDGTLAYEKFALEVLGIVDQAGLGITFRVDIRMIHISFSIHDFIPFPIDYRATRNSHLEYIRIVGDK